VRSKPSASHRNHITSSREGPFTFNSHWRDVVMFYVLRDTNIGSTYVEQSVLQTIGVCRYKTSTCRVRMLGEDSAAISIVVALRPYAAQYGSVPSIHHHRS